MTWLVRIMFTLEEKSVENGREEEMYEEKMKNCEASYIYISNLTSKGRLFMWYSPKEMLGFGETDPDMDNPITSDTRGIRPGIVLNPSHWMNKNTRNYRHIWYDTNFIIQNEKESHSSFLFLQAPHYRH